MVLTGSRASSRRVTIRLDRLTPRRWRPTARPFRGSWGSRRFRHKRTPPGYEYVLRDLRRGRRNVYDLPGPLHPTPAQGGMAFGAGLRGVDHPPGGFHPRPAEAVLTLLSRLLFLLRWLLAPGGRFMPRHPGPQPTAGQPGHQAFDPLAQFGNRALLPGDDPLLFRDDRQQVSRLAWSSPVSIVPLCHNSAPAASAFQPGGGLRQIRLTKSEQLLDRHGAGQSHIGLSLRRELRWRITR